MQRQSSGNLSIKGTLKVHVQSGSGKRRKNKGNKRKNTSTHIIAACMAGACTCLKDEDFTEPLRAAGGNKGYTQFKMYP